MSANNAGKVFDYKSLRLLVGFIALALPFVVTFLSHNANNQLSSISASYYTDAQDAFVGMLFIVGAFLGAYNGHTPWQGRLSKVAGLAAIGVALFPTACDSCETDITAIIHYGSAATLFIILASFCFVFFQKNTKGKSGKKGQRSKIYFACGATMVACMVGLVVAHCELPAETVKAWRLTFWAEAIALGAFGVAWIVAGKYFRILVDEEVEETL